MTRNNITDNCEVTIHDRNLGAHKEICLWSTVAKSPGMHPWSKKDGDNREPG